MAIKLNGVNLEPVYQKLPQEFQEVEYIESTGSQRIDTGLTVMTGSRWYSELDMEYTLVQSGSQVAIASSAAQGSWLGQNGNQYAITGGVDGRFNNVAANSRQVAYSTWGVAPQTTIGDLTRFFLDTVSTAYGKVTLFATPSDSYPYYSSMKLYGVKIYNGDHEIIREFVPCYRKSDNKTGLYDLANNQFYSDEKGGEFEIGDVVKGHPYKVIYRGEVIYPTSTPSYLKEVKCIYTGTTGAYTDIGIIPSSDTRVVTKVKKYVNATQFFFGSSETVAANAFAVVCIAGPSGKYTIRSDYSNESPSLGLVDIDKWVIIEKDGVKTTATLEDGTVLEKTNTAKSITTKNTMAVFAIHQDSGYTSAANAAMYYMKVYEHDILVRDLVPMVDTRTGIAGLYDKISGEFYTSLTENQFMYEENTISEYELVNYIQSNATQYIDTGVNANQGTKLTTEIEFLNEINEESPFGAYENDSKFQWHFSYSNYSYPMFGNSTTDTVHDLKVDTRYLLDLSSDGAYLNGALVKTYASQSFQMTDSINLFRRNPISGTTLPRMATIKMYGCKIYVNGVLLRNFVPAIRRTDRISGLYDKENDTFYKDVNGNNFEYPAVLPNEYQEIEYIESDGNSYIDTGIIPTQNTKVVETRSAGVADAISGGDINANYRFKWGTSGETRYYIGYNGNNYSVTSPAPNINTFATYTIAKGIQRVEVDDITVIDQSNTSVLGNYLDRGLCLLGFYENGTLQSLKQSREKCCQIYENGILVRDFVACYRKSDGIAGLYDRVNNVFYTSMTDTPFAYPVSGRMAEPSLAMVRQMFSSLSLGEES